jgi:hypothetical protein
VPRDRKGWEPRVGPRSGGERPVQTEKKLPRETGDAVSPRGVRPSATSSEEDNLGDDMAR